MSVRPVVSVRTVTYNHEKYIAQCLEGVLMQRTAFPFELIVGEDCSTDRTREVVLAYEKQYPDKVRAITSAANVGAAQNAARVLQACRGKYHAFCEGDDCWIDPLKLQKQVEFLESHPGIPACFHNTFVVNESDFGVRLNYASAMQERLAFSDACQTFIQLSTLMARSEILATLPEWLWRVWCSDIVVCLWCAHHGDLGYLKEIMAVYRRHPGGMILTMGPLREKRRSEELFMYGELDRETHYQHTADLQARMRQVESKFQRERLGPLYFLLHPGKFVAKVREYHTLVGQQYRMYR
jgi:glycosyltransferase involved in cell wall biosynthesis